MHSAFNHPHEDYHEGEDIEQQRCRACERLEDVLVELEVPVQLEHKEHSKLQILKQDAGRQ